MMVIREHRSSILFTHLSELDTILMQDLYTPLLFTNDYVIIKLICRLMRHGRKFLAFKILIRALMELKRIFGFQPFFSFKHYALGMRQLFKTYKVTIRGTKIIQTPAILQAHNQVTYGLNNLICCKNDIKRSERIKTHVALSIVFANTFASTYISNKKHD